MTAGEFTAASIALLRSSVGWQTAIARRLGIESRTVRRWLAAGEAPEWVGEKLRALMGGSGRGPFPRDEWMAGDGVTADGRAREYIVHLAPPRFVARVVAIDDSGLPEAAEEPADVLTGIVYSAAEGTLLCEIDWIDQPRPGEITQLMEAAADALDLLAERAAERDDFKSE